MGWFRDLIKAKISITLVYPPAPGVTSTTTPRVIDETPIVCKQNKSNLRFGKHVVINGSDETAYYYTEQKTAYGWSQVSNSWYDDKDKAIAAHLEICDTGEASGKRTVTTILWEGLDRDETEVWASISKESNNE